MSGKQLSLSHSNSILSACYIGLNMYKTAIEQTEDANRTKGNDPSNLKTPVDIKHAATNEKFIVNFWYLLYLDLILPTGQFSAYKSQEYYVKPPYRP